MKLISCYIEAFGNLRRRSYRFQDGLNVFMEENGSGKSTLAAFLKAMLYGMETYTAATKGFVDRMHYYPFDGGQFGGNLVFEWDGDEYKIERFFGEKSKTRDRLTVYRNGELYTGFGDEIGKEIFGIDRDAFERTAFVNSDDIEIGTTASISAKLNHFVRGGEEGDYDKALSLLDNAARLFKNTRSQGKIRDLELEIGEIEGKIRNLQAMKIALVDKYGTLSQKKEELKKLEAAIKKLREHALVLKDWERYDELVDACSKLEEQIEAIKSRYPEGLPSEEEIAAMRSLLDKIADCRARARVSLMSDEELSDFARYGELFRAGIPTDTELAEAVGFAKEATRCETERQSLDKRMAQPVEAESYFPMGVPAEDSVREAQENHKTLLALEERYHAMPTTLNTPVSDAKGKGKSGKIYPILAILAAILLVGGIGLIFVSLYVGIALAAVGVILLLAVAFLYLNAKTAAGSPQYAALPNPERLELEKEATALRTRLEIFLRHYGYSSEEGIAVSLTSLIRDREDHLKAIGTKRESIKARKELCDLCEGYLSKVRTLTSAYGIAIVDPERAVALLKRMIDSYRALMQKKQKSAENTEKLALEEQGYREELAALGERFAMGMPDGGVLDRISKDGDTYRRLIAELVSQKEKTEAFRRDKKLDKRPEPIALSYEAEEENEKLLRDEISRIEREIDAAEGEVEALDFWESELEGKKALLSEYQHKYKLLSAAAELLKTADKTQKEQYIAPIRDHYREYADMIESALGENLTMTGNFEIRFERGGKERSDRHLSAGQRSICTFCFRQALIQRMYPDEMPFLILDDPFVSLDETHMTRMGEVLKSLANEMQILYFTCHKSRVIES